MTYDAAHGQIVLFGGDIFNDTWVWDGSNWIQKPSPGIPPARYSSALAGFSGNNPPTSLDGVQVTIGGQKAFVDYVAVNPGQVNAQLPSNMAPVRCN